MGVRYQAVQWNGNKILYDLYILPLVADPVRAEREIARVGDILQFRADATAYQRL